MVQATHLAFLGLSVMSYFRHLSSSATLIVSNPNFVKKVVFPLEVLPVAQVGNLAFNFSISLGLCLIGAILLGDGFSMAWIWLPLIILPSLFYIAWDWVASGISWRVFSRYRSIDSVSGYGAPLCEWGFLLCRKNTRNLLEFSKI